METSTTFVLSTSWEKKIIWVIQTTQTGALLEFQGSSPLDRPPNGDPPTNPQISKTKNHQNTSINRFKADSPHLGYSPNPRAGRLRWGKTDLHQRSTSSWSSPPPRSIFSPSPFGCCCLEKLLEREGAQERGGAASWRWDFYLYILMLSALDLHTLFFFSRTCMCYRQLIFTPITFWTEW